jgi:carboxypeptidase D
MIIRPVSVRSQHEHTLLSNQIVEFAVNGTGIPDVDFDLGESYAGLLPIGDANDANQLYFWFFPSTNPAAEKEIAIWLTGGVRYPTYFTIYYP